MIWYFQTWDHTLELFARIASLQLRNYLDESQQRRCYEIVIWESSIRIFVWSIPIRAIRGRGGGKKIEDEIDTPKPDLFRKPCKQHFRFVLFSASSPLFREKSTPLERTRARFRRDTSDRDDSEFAIVGSKVSRLCPRHNKHHHGDHVARESSVRGRRRAWSLAVTSRTEPRARHRVRK